MNINEILKANSTIVENELQKYMDIDSYGLEEAMKYSLLGGGKRIRPFLAIETYKLFSKECKLEEILPFACAIEMIHTYSLIHDDLPCMDNDDYRRGKLTSHKKFGEANALLAGDALLTYAFYVASNNKHVNKTRINNVILELSKCAGFQGMVGGQVIDLDEAESKNTIDKLNNMYLLKTGALLRCSALIGYYTTVDNPDKRVVNSLLTYANDIGLAFQYRDDILDVIADEKVLGKPTGSDEKNNKTTILSYMSIDEAQKEIIRLTNEAKESISGLANSQNNVLSELATFLLDRDK